MWHVVNVAGDGHCFFRATSHALFGHDNDNDVLLGLRILVANAVCARFDDMAVHVLFTHPGNLSSASDYRAFMVNHTEAPYASDIEARALACALGLRVEIYSDDGGVVRTYDATIPTDVLRLTSTFEPDGNVESGILRLLHTGDRAGRYQADHGRAMAITAC